MVGVKTKISFTSAMQQKNDYFILDLKLPEEERPIGKYGYLHNEYLKERHPARYNYLILSCQLWSYLADVNEQALERLEIIMKQMQETEAVTEELKAKDQWEWVRRMNSIRNRAEEIVLDEIIYR
jgi:hypothetical protein